MNTHAAGEESRSAASPPSTDPFLHLQGIDKSFGALRVLEAVDLSVSRGEVLALLGPSGSGKTTLLRLLAGFETPDAGRITVAGEDVTSLPPARRGFGMVFQHYALFPHLTVGENVAFGLETRGWDRGRIAGRIDEMLALVDLAGFAERRLTQVSGGQQQRVALARALAPEPRLLLLDEPLSNLDPSLRERTRQQLRQTVDRVGITTVLVTHEQEEAFHLGDRVAVLHRGRLQQVGRPEDLYERPASRFVATFVGRASVLDGVLEALEGEHGRLRIRGFGGISPLWGGVAAEPLAVGEPAQLVLRPESLSLTQAGAPGALPGTVVGRRYGGPVTYFQIALTMEPATAPGAGEKVLEVLADPAAVAVGDRVGLLPRTGGLAPRLFAPAGEGA